MTYEANIRGAVFDFAGYLTIMDDEYTVGASHNAARMADEAKRFLAKRGMDGDDANVFGWQDITGMERWETQPEQKLGACERCGGSGYLTIESPRCPDCNQGSIQEPGPGKEQSA